ncbi:tetratricopeptide repeat protein [Alcanivorax sp.]|jgi:tetratricopeptide (TPR) repeat protein|uniref:tetratricopeptide repeat protein n=1 Tax=Alcanivorax sp. TaxID=1872427 RepID=UPI0032D98727
MSTLSINAARATRYATGSALLLLVLLFTGCASRQGGGLDGTAEGIASKYQKQKSGAAAASSDAVHIPPVAHDPKVEKVAQQAMGDYAHALQTRIAGNNPQALVMFQSLAERYPQLSGPPLNIGLIHIELQNYPKAQAAFEQSLAINEANPYAHNGLGLALREQGEFDNARIHYERALVLDPKYARAHFNLAVLGELYLQDINLALEHFQAYQNLQKQPDENVANWIVDLERRAPEQPSQPVAENGSDLNNSGEMN